jgi:hypothetical protein
MESRLTTADATALISAAAENHLHTLIKSINIQRDATAEHPESVEQAAMITARFNRLPVSRCSSSPCFPDGNSNERLIARRSRL